MDESRRRKADSLGRSRASVSAIVGMPSQRAIRKLRLKAGGVRERDCCNDTILRGKFVGKLGSGVSSLSVVAHYRKQPQTTKTNQYRKIAIGAL